jgi:hypothetical protein
MKTVKASLRINKNGRLYCTAHQTYRVIIAPRNDCKICWELFDKNFVQPSLDSMIKDLEEEIKGKKANE